MRMSQWSLRVSIVFEPGDGMARFASNVSPEPVAEIAGSSVDVPGNSLPIDRKRHREAIIDFKFPKQIPVLIPASFTQLRLVRMDRILF